MKTAEANVCSCGTAVLCEQCMKALMQQAEPVIIKESAA